MDQKHYLPDDRGLQALATATLLNARLDANTRKALIRMVDIT